MSLSNLPPELILNIAGSLRLRDLARLIRINSRFAHVLTGVLYDRVVIVNPYGRQASEIHEELLRLRKFSLKYIRVLNVPYRIMQCSILWKSEYIFNWIKAKDLSLFTCLNLYGLSALHEFTMNGSTNVVDCLLARGANPNLKSTNGESPLLAMACSSSVFWPCGWFRFAKVMEIFLKYGTDLTIQTTKGRSILLEAAREAPERVFIYIIRSMPYDDDTAIIARDKHGHSPLWYAVQRRLKTAVFFLLERGAMLMDGDRFGVVPLHLAARQGDLEMCNILLFEMENQNLDISVANDKDTNAFDMALLAGHEWLAEHLRLRGIPNFRNLVLPMGINS